MRASNYMAISGDLPSIFLLFLLGFLIRKVIISVLDKIIEDTRRYYNLKSIVTFLYFACSIVGTMFILNDQRSVERYVIFVILVGGFIFYKAKKNNDEGYY